ncbi:MAG TPA: discoidin domain-containing protein [Polyangia bacterium]|jgi:hypothetical protein|nr:discoidin domain-containing protein [Polyangia bacterium]
MLLPDFQPRDSLRRNQSRLLLVAALVWSAVGCTSPEPFRSSQSFTQTDAEAEHVSSGSGGFESGTGSGGQGALSGSGGSGGTQDGSGGSGGSFGGGSGGLFGGSGGAVDSGAPDRSTSTGGSGGTNAGSGGNLGSGGAGSGGSSGTGGTFTVDGCARANWNFTANTLCDTSDCTNIQGSDKDPQYAIDGNTGTRYSSGRPQGSAGAENVVLSFPHVVHVNGIRLLTLSAGDGPAAYKVQYSADGSTFLDFSPAAVGTGADDLSISFPAATVMKSFRVTQTGSKAVSWWSIHELTLIGCTNN